MITAQGTTYKTIEAAEACLAALGAENALYGESDGRVTEQADVLYKAIRPDGASFYDPEFRWLPEGWKSGDPIPADWVVRHPNPGARIGKRSDTWAGEYLSVATVPTDFTGFKWPCMLLEVEPVGRACLDDQYANKRRVRAARVFREVPAHEVFGPQGADVVAILDRAAELTAEEVENLAAAWRAARGVAWDAVWDVAQRAAWDAAWEVARRAGRSAAWRAAWEVARRAVWDAAWRAAWDVARRVALDAAGATLVRDLISTEHHDQLIGPWRAVMGDLLDAGWTDHKTAD